MAADRSYVSRNREARERLQAVVRRLSDEDLRRPLGEGWTVAASLAHVAFWDRRAVVLVERFEKGGVRPSPVDVDVINDAALAQARLIPPRLAADEAVTAAKALDERLEALSDDLLAANLANGGPLRLDRASHRNDHLDEIERALSNSVG